MRSHIILLLLSMTLTVNLCTKPDGANTKDVSDIFTIDVFTLVNNLWYHKTSLDNINNKK